MQKLGVKKVWEHPEVHIPLQELLDGIKKIEGKK